MGPSPLYDGDHCLRRQPRAAPQVRPLVSQLNFLAMPLLDSTGKVVVPVPAQPNAAVIIDPWKEYIRSFDLETCTRKHLRDLVQTALDLPVDAVHSLTNVCTAAKQGAQASR